MKTIQKVQWLTAALFGVLGLIAILAPQSSAFLLIRTLGWLGAFSGFFFLVDAVRKKRSLDGVGGLLCLLFFVWVLVGWNHDDSILQVLFCVYYAIIAIVFLIQAFLDGKERVQDWKAETALGLLYAALSASGAFGLAYIQNLFGLYLWLQALQLVLELYFFRHPYNVRYAALRPWMCLPAWIVGVLPSFVIGFLVTRRMENKATHFDARKTDEQPDLRVWIHTGTYGTKLYGHMTFSRDSIMYSYGNYDVPAMKLLKTIGPGVFFSVNDEIYANNCCIVEQCPLFEYGIRLTGKQKEAFEAMKDSILAQSKPWHCALQKAEWAHGPVDFQDFEHVYANRLWYRTCALFRKYTKTRWAWYSLLGNNCSNFDSAMLNQIGLDIPVSHGIVSPGEFFEYFEEAYEDPDSNVISKSWHSARVPSTLFPTID